MRRSLLFAALFALGSAAAARAADIPIDQVSLPAPSGRAVHVKFPVGELRVEAATGNRVTLELTARCKGWNTDRCEENAREIEIESDVSGGTLDLDVKNYPKFHANGFHLRGVLRIPSDLDLKIDMGVGDLEIRDVDGDLSVDLGVGDADIQARTRAVRSVEVSAGVGDADVIAGGSRVRRHGFVGSSASWDEGRGRSSVNLHVGVGDATVRID